MAITLPARLWARLPFIARLGVSTGLALVVSGAAMLYSSSKTDSTWFQEQLAAQAENELESLIPALAEQVVIGDFSTMAQMLEARVRRDNIDSLYFVQRKGNMLQANSITPAAPRAPDWFVRFSGLHGEDASADLAVGGTRYGVLSIRMTPVPAINRTWETFRNHLMILALAVGLNFLGILIILKAGLRPLDALNQGAKKLGAGELAARIPTQGSPEMQEVISTFNGMADNIQSLLTQVHREKDLAQVTLQSIGDAVITTDDQERVVCLNPVAEALTGWNNEEAAGRPLQQVFNIFNEYTREPVENPVDKVLREGIVVGLANHTLLIARDGRECPIEDSAAPIRDRDGRILGIVLVFHDVGEKRKLAHQLSYQAKHDALTGLINRSEFERQLTAQVQTRVRESDIFARLQLLARRLRQRHVFLLLPEKTCRWIT